MEYCKVEFKGYIIIVFISTLPFVVGSNIDCNGKAFHCLNSTHFKICVDLGGGVSKTVDEFVIPCPQDTVCKQYNLFECEFELTTTLPPERIQSEVTNEQFQPTEETSAGGSSDVTLFTDGVTPLSTVTFVNGSFEINTLTSTTETYYTDKVLNRNLNGSNIEENPGHLVKATASNKQANNLSSPPILSNIEVANGTLENVDSNLTNRNEILRITDDYGMMTTSNVLTFTNVSGNKSSSEISTALDNNVYNITIADSFIDKQNLMLNDKEQTSYTEILSFKNISDVTTQSDSINVTKSLLSIKSYLPDKRLVSSTENFTLNRDLVNESHSSVLNNFDHLAVTKSLKTASPLLNSTTAVTEPTIYDKITVDGAIKGNELPLITSVEVVTKTQTSILNVSEELMTSKTPTIELHDNSSLIYSDTIPFTDATESETMIERISTDVNLPPSLTYESQHNAFNNLDVLVKTESPTHSSWLIFNSSSFKTVSAEPAPYSEMVFKSDTIMILGSTKVEAANETHASGFNVSDLLVPKDLVNNVSTTIDVLPTPTTKIKLIPNVSITSATIATFEKESKENESLIIGREDINQTPIIPLLTAATVFEISTNITKEVEYLSHPSVTAKELAVAFTAATESATMEVERNGFIDINLPSSLTPDVTYEIQHTALNDLDRLVKTDSPAINMNQSTRRLLSNTSTIATGTTEPATYSDMAVKTDATMILVPTKAEMTNETHTSGLNVFDLLQLNDLVNNISTTDDLPSSRSKIITDVSKASTNIVTDGKKSEANKSIAMERENKNEAQILSLLMTAAAGLVDNTNLTPEVEYNYTHFYRPTVSKKELVTAAINNKLAKTNSQTVYILTTSKIEPTVIELSTTTDAYDSLNNENVGTTRTVSTILKPLSESISRYTLSNSRLLTTLEKPSLLRNTTTITEGVLTNIDGATPNIGTKNIKQSAHNLNGKYEITNPNSSTASLTESLFLKNASSTNGVNASNTSTGFLKDYTTSEHNNANLDIITENKLIFKTNASIINDEISSIVTTTYFDSHFTSTHDDVLTETNTSTTLSSDKKMIENANFTSSTTEKLLLTKLGINNNFSQPFHVNINDKNNKTLSDISEMFSEDTNNIPEKLFPVEVVDNKDLNYTDKKILSLDSGHINNTNLNGFSHNLLTDNKNITHIGLRKNITLTTTSDEHALLNNYYGTYNNTSRNVLIKAADIENIQYKNNAEYILVNPVSTTVVKTKELPYTFLGASPSESMKESHNFAKENITILKLDKNSKTMDYYEPHVNNTYIMKNKLISNVNTNHTETATQLNMVLSDPLSENVLKPLLSTAQTSIKEGINRTTKLVPYNVSIDRFSLTDMISPETSVNSNITIDSTVKYVTLNSSSSKTSENIRYNGTSAPSHELTKEPFKEDVTANMPIQFIDSSKSSNYSKNEMPSVSTVYNLEQKLTIKYNETEKKGNRPSIDYGVSTTTYSLRTINNNSGMSVDILKTKYNNSNISLTLTPKIVNVDAKHREYVQTQQEFRCVKRGKYSDNIDCNKFYICIGRFQPIVGACPPDTVFSDFLKQCTKNVAHCIRNNQFKCLAPGRFNNILSHNTYFICTKKGKGFTRFTMQCQKGYYLNKSNIKCTQESSNISISDEDNSRIIKEESVEKAEEKEGRSSNNNQKYFKCDKEGKFEDPENSRRYYVCKKGNKSTFRLKIKNCDSDEVFHKKKKKCVDEESYECDI